MPASYDRICYERIVPQELANASREAARSENPVNAPALEGAAVKSKLWKPGRTLRVAFLDGDPSVQERVQRAASEWTRHAHIHFSFGNDPEAEIRISFQGEGSWSALGTDALVRAFFPLDGPTMNFGWLTPASTDEDVAGVVLHEFGHALGMIHEHQNPAGGIQWNREAVIRDLSGPPNNWDAATIEHNVFARYSESQTQFTEFDPSSIMLYSFPRHWTLNNMAFPQNNRVSPTDVAFIRERYPR